MIILGIDVHGTISTNPKIYKRLAENIIMGGGEVHIITAVMAHREEAIRKEVKKYRVPYTQLHVVIYEDRAQMPQMKLDICKQFHISMMIDDINPICELLNKNGIVALNALPIHYI